jgi:polar amino acid transport system substrate-binding protein
MFKFNATALAFIALLFIPAIKAETFTTAINEQKTCLSMHVVLNTLAGYLDKNGKIAGFHIDFLDALEKKTGICMDKKLLPYSRAKHSIKMSAHDGGILARSKDLDKKVIYIAKLLTSETVIIPKKGQAFTNYQDLKNITIGKVRGVTLDKSIGENKKLTFIDVLNYKNGLAMLKKGRIDAIVGNSLGLSAITELEMAEDVNLSGKLVLGQREVWFLLSNKSSHLDKVEQLKEATLALIEDKVVDKILKKYFGSSLNPYDSNL